MTYNNPQGISRKTTSISFIWYQLFWIGASDEAYVTSGKSGLNFNALDLLISVLSNKAVLGCCFSLLVFSGFWSFPFCLSLLLSLCLFLFDWQVCSWVQFQLFPCLVRTNLKASLSFWHFKNSGETTQNSSREKNLKTQLIKLWMCFQFLLYIMWSKQSTSQEETVHDL